MICEICTCSVDPDSVPLIMYPPGGKPSNTPPEQLTYHCKDCNTLLAKYAMQQRPMMPYGQAVMICLDKQEWCGEIRGDYKPVYLSWFRDWEVAK